ncbi:type IV pilus assembly protein PilM [Candidatus Kaiserbacteria bacterium]|nr:type IV pilus assembly protein PilM [Candidatus Kaiserbacteria bacterium]MCB9811359.1 type IV pilus assembly protein PilM [Candidatus Nomurabacteria bacterium]
MAFSLSTFFTSKRAAPVTRAVGIDIGSSSVKVVELEHTERALMLRTYGELQLGPYAGAELGETVRLDQKAQTEAVVDVLRESKAEAKDGVFAMPLASSFMTVVPVVAASDEELEAKINVEAKKFIPLPLSEVTLNWTTLSKVGEIESSSQEVLLAAIENKALGEYNLLLNSIGMTAQPSEIEVFSTVRSLVSESSGYTAILDIGAKTTKLYLTCNGYVERVHRVPVGGAAVTNKLAQLLSLSWTQAEEFKRSSGSDQERLRDIHNTVSAVFESPLREFARVISRYEATTQIPIQKIVLTGGGAATLGINKLTETVMQRLVVTADPFAHVGYPAFMEDELKQIGPSFSVALGAAQRLFM